MERIVVLLLSVAGSLFVSVALCVPCVALFFELLTFTHAVVALVGLASIAQRGASQTVLEAPEVHVTRTPSRVPDIPVFGMGYNDRLGIKPLCTHETDKRGMVDCIPRDAAGLSGNGGVDGMGGVSTGNVGGGGGTGGFCAQTCIQCANGMLAGPGCESCMCGVNSDYIKSGTAPDNCNQVCYYCRTSMLSGYECDGCSCGHWPAPLLNDPLENSLY